MTSAKMMYDRDVDDHKISYAPWLVCTCFVLLQFYLQLSSGVVIGTIMHEMHLSAFMASLLSSSFYIVYTLLQIPVGILSDKKNPRVILTLSALTLGVGCFIFAASHSLVGLFCGRLLLGIGSAFAFVNMVHIVRTNYPLKYFSTLVGTCETLGFLATVAGVIGMGQFIINYGWRFFLEFAGALGFIVALFCWLKIPDSQNIQKIAKSHFNNLYRIIANKYLWMNGTFIGLNFAVITVFGALWAAPFLQVKLHCDIRQASIINAFLFLGASAGCPFFGYLSAIIKKRKGLIISSCFIAAAFLAIVIYLPTQNATLMSAAMFLSGFTCCSYILAYAIGNELSPPDALSTSAGFTNTLALITAPILQPLIGYALDFTSSDIIYSLLEYQTALIIMPVGLLVSAGLVALLPNDK